MSPLDPYGHRHPFPHWHTHVQITKTKTFSLNYSGSEARHLWVASIDIPLKLHAPCVTYTCFTLLAMLKESTQRRVLHKVQKYITHSSGSQNVQYQGTSILCDKNSFLGPHMRKSGPKKGCPLSVTSHKYRSSLFTSLLEATQDYILVLCKGTVLPYNSSGEISLGWILNWCRNIRQNFLWSLSNILLHVVTVYRYKIP